MSDHCCHAPAPQDGGPSYRRALWIAFALNAGMFAVEVAAGSAAGSLSLLADALDFFGDACNFLIGLYLIDKTTRRRAAFSLAKAAVMAGFAVFILIDGIARLFAPHAPSYEAMGIVGLLALLANLASAAVLMAHRDGDSNRRSIWLCTRNDAIGNVLVMLAALGVFMTGSALPDLVVALVMASLGLSAGWQVARQAAGELRHKEHDRRHDGHA